MIDFRSFIQRNALDQWSNDPSLDHEDQWCNESLSRVDLIDHWSENGFAQKDNHRSEILIWILPKECTHTFYILATNSKIIKKLIFTLYNFFQKIMICLSQCICFIYQSSGEQAPSNSVLLFWLSETHAPIISVDMVQRKGQENLWIVP